MHVREIYRIIRLNLIRAALSNMLYEIVKTKRPCVYLNRCSGTWCVCTCKKFYCNSDLTEILRKRSRAIKSRNIRVSGWKSSRKVTRRPPLYNATFKSIFFFFFYTTVLKIVKRSSFFFKKKGQKKNWRFRDPFQNFVSI